MRINHKHIEIPHLYLYIIGTILLIVIGFGSYRIYALSQNLESANETISVNNDSIINLQNTKHDLEEELDQTKSINEDLESQLAGEQKQNNKLSGKVDTLTKLTTIDPELLKKYSKVFFLSENYEPEKLDEIPSKYVTANKTLEFLDPAIDFLEDLLKDANNNNVPLRVASAYRSFGEQSALKSNYVFTYGAGTANQFSADQGYSEHQLGTTVDFSTPTIIGAYPAFENDPAYSWLQKNAYKYGFILSYPKNNSYYEYEPWHWRFVGKDLARYLYDHNINFYDMDQRDIDGYLIKIFDK